MSDDIQPKNSSEIALPGGGEVSYDPLPEASVAPAGTADLDMVLDVPVVLTVEIGRTTMTIRETLDIGPGAIITLDKMTGEPVDLLVNGRRIARGEVVAIDEEFGLRVTQIVSPDQRLDAAA
jgi:flagellar motor switch protein FliN/FliY